MEFEIHVTVKSPHMLSFMNHCQMMVVKPIIIETEKDDYLNNQIMTSSKHKADDYAPTLHLICNELKEKGYEIIREKVEIRPYSIKHHRHIYYETHFRLKLPKQFDRTVLKVLCKELNFHLSKNLFKKDDYQLITYRNYNTSFDNFNFVINNMKQKLINLHIDFDKVEIEECIHDSNVKVDANWIGYESKFKLNENKGQKCMVDVVGSNALEKVLEKFDQRAYKTKI